MDLLKLNGLEVNCIIGDLPEERIHEQALLINVELSVDLRKCSKSDDLSDTVDYAELSIEIRKALQNAKCRMIERAARIVCEVCLDYSELIRKVSVSVIKRGAVIGLASAEVCMEIEVEDEEA